MNESPSDVPLYNAVLISTALLTTLSLCVLQPRAFSPTFTWSICINPNNQSILSLFQGFRRVGVLKKNNNWLMG
jgi:hypothetical protein